MEGMIDEFEAIGLHVPDHDKLKRKIGRQDIPYARTAPGIDALGCFTEESGARILVAEKSDEVELWPTVRSEAAARPANVTLVSPFVGLVDVFDDESELTHRLIAGIEDPFRFDIELTAGAPAVFFSALPVDVRAYSTAEEYEGPVPFGSDFISAPDLFALADGELSRGELAPYVWLGLRVGPSEVRTNELNGLQFRVMTTDRNLPLTVALPASLPVSEEQWLWGTWKLMASLGSWDA